MSKSKISFLLFSIYCFGALGQSTLNWLQQNVIPISTTSQYVYNTNEFEPLRKILLGKDIVMLGEEDHVFSTSVETKTKLIQFLHDELGFTVLAFENDLYTMACAYEKAAADSSPNILRNATWPFWGWSTSTKTLFPYVISASKNNPLKVIGFDCQTRNQYPFVDAINNYLSARKSPIVRYSYYSKFYDIFKKCYYQAGMYQYAVGKQDELLLFYVLDDILFEMDLDTSKANHVKILKQSLINFKNNLNNIWLNQPSNYNFLGYPKPHDSVYGFVADKQSMGSQTRRDKLMAENIKWIKEVLYPGEKIIIWAATEHTMYNRHLATFHNFLVDSNFMFSSRFRFKQGYKSMGTYIKEYFGDRVYNVGFTTLGGKVDYDRTGSNPSIYNLQFDPNSLESYFSKLNSQNGFLDLNNPYLPFELKSHFLFHNFIGGQPNTTGDISIFFNGLIFIREMKPIEYYRE